MHTTAARSHGPRDLHDAKVDGTRLVQVFIRVAPILRAHGVQARERYVQYRACRYNLWVSEWRSRSKEGQGAAEYSHDAKVDGTRPVQVAVCVAAVLGTRTNNQRISTQQKDTNIVRTLHRYLVVLLLTYNPPVKHQSLSIGADPVCSRVKARATKF